MRSSKQTANKTYEAELKKLLAQTHGLLKQQLRVKITTRAEDFRKKLIGIALRYIDEINKIQSRRSPLATCMLLSALMEAILQVVILGDIARARNTSQWTKASLRKELYPNPLKALGIPSLTLDDLIAVVWQANWLNTSQVGEHGSELFISRLKPEVFPTLKIDPENEAKLRGLLRNGDEAKGNKEQMHSLRKLRNAIHPLELMENPKLQGQEAFQLALYSGCRLLLIINELVRSNDGKLPAVALNRSMKIKMQVGQPSTNS